MLAAVGVLEVQWVAGEHDVVVTDGPPDDVGGLLSDNLPEKVAGNVVDLYFCHCDFGGLSAGS